MNCEQSFEESCRSKTASEVQFETWKRGFGPTLEQLRADLKRVPKMRSAWESRLSVVQQRYQAALKRGLLHTRLSYLLQELGGGNGRQGLIPSIEPTITGYIAMIEEAAPTILPHRNTWICWYALPGAITNSMNMTEQWLTEAESITKNEGELHQMLEARVAQPIEMSTTVVPARPEPTQIVVET